MAADVGTTLASWSATAASNQPDNSDAVGPNTLADNLRTIQSVVRDSSGGDGTIASATTTDLSTVSSNYITVTGTTTITGFGTVSAGIIKTLRFSGALTLTHNATSLILPLGGNFTTTVGDIFVFRSEGSGNWRCIASQTSGSQSGFIQIYEVQNQSISAANFTANRHVGICNKKMVLVAASVVFGTASSSGTVTVEKLTGTTAPGGGTALLTGTMSLSGATNTVVNGTLIGTYSSLLFAPGDRIGLVFGGTATSLATCVISLTFAPA